MDADGLVVTTRAGDRGAVLENGVHAVSEDISDNLEGRTFLAELADLLLGTRGEGTSADLARGLGFLGRDIEESQESFEVTISAAGSGEVDSVHGIYPWGFGLS